MSYAKNEMKVIEWAHRNGLLVDEAEPMASLAQVQIELGDLMFQTLVDDLGEIKDQIGFCMIHLIVYCAQQDIDLVDAIQSGLREMHDLDQPPTRQLKLVNPLRPQS